MAQVNIGLYHWTLGLFLLQASIILKAQRPPSEMNIPHVRARGGFWKSKMAGILGFGRH